MSINVIHVIWYCVQTVLGSTLNTNIRFMTKTGTFVNVPANDIKLNI